MPFGPEGEPIWTKAVEALLAPLAVLAACASIVWGLQDRLTDVGEGLRTLMAEHRDRAAQNRPTQTAQIRMLLRRAIRLRNAVVLFYLAMALQVAVGCAVGVALTGQAVPPHGLRAAFLLSLLPLLGGVWLALVDTVRSNQAAETEARALGLCR